MNDFIMEYTEIQQHPNPVFFSWNKSLNYLSFPISHPWRTFGEMFILSEPDLVYCPNAYHNHIHSAEAIFSAAILLKEELTHEQCIYYGPYLLFAMMCHDIAHNGSHNIYPYQLEKLAINEMKNHLNTPIMQSYWTEHFFNTYGNFHRFQRKITRIILGTEFVTGLQKNIAAYKNNQKNNFFVNLNTLANEADILVSIMSYFGQEKGLLLSIEQNNEQLATKEGQLYFLQHLVHYVSVASKKLNIEHYLLTQIDSIKVNMK